MCENCSLIVRQTNFTANKLLKLCGGVQITVNLHADRLLARQPYVQNNFSSFGEPRTILYGSDLGFIVLGTPMVRSFYLRVVSMKMERFGQPRGHHL